MPKRRTLQPKLSVSIIGPGRLGQALALVLTDAGYLVRTLVARRAAKAKEAAAQLRRVNSSVQAVGGASLARLVSSDLILITTPDDAIEETAQKLAVLDINNVRGQTVLHTSGALSSAVLAPLARVGFHTGSLHPLVSVSEPLSGAKALRGAFYCIEGDRSAAKLARRMVKDLGGRSFSIAPDTKALYHAAALIAAGHLTALIDLAIEMLVSCGLGRRAAQEVLLPLVESAVNNLKQSSPEKSLTGTFARGDLATVQRHLTALSGKNQSEALRIYKLLGLRSLRLAGKKKIDKHLLGQIEDLLLDT